MTMGSAKDGVTFTTIMSLLIIHCYRKRFSRFGYAFHPLVRMTIWSSPVLGNLLPPSCLSGRTKSGKLSVDDYSAFLFGPEEKVLSTELVGSLLANIATGTAAALVMGSNPAVPVALACIPIIVPMSTAQLGGASSAALSLISEDAKGFVKGITYVSIAQGTLAMADIVFGDVLSGFMKAMFAGIGFYATTMEDGTAILPSYTVVSFINGCIMLLSAFENMSARRTPMFAGAMPLYLNYIHMTQLLHPLLCFAGAYMGWQVIKELRRTGVFQSATMAQPPVVERRPDQGRLLSASVASGTSFAPFSGTGRSLSQSTIVTPNPAPTN